MKFDLEEIQETLGSLDPQNIGSWPVYIKAVIFAAVFVAVFTAGNYFLVVDVITKLQKQQETEAKLIKEFEEKSFQAANLEEFTKQMEELDNSYAALLRQLPKETEVPGLLEDITHTGLGSGLRFDSIDLGKEEGIEFYAVLPINLTVRGAYHGLAGFVSGVAALPRIVTLHDFVIDTDKSADIRTPGSMLTMVIKAKTYRYKDEPAENKAPVSAPQGRAKPPAKGKAK